MGRGEETVQRAVAESGLAEQAIMDSLEEELAITDLQDGGGTIDGGYLIIGKGGSGHSGGSPAKRCGEIPAADPDLDPVSLARRGVFSMRLDDNEKPTEAASRLEGDRQAAPGRPAEPAANALFGHGGLELPAKVVQERLGHSSIVMTLDTYGHLFPRGDDGSELAEAERALLR